MATGKFGLGFSSASCCSWHIWIIQSFSPTDSYKVFNWTDCPAIVSGSTLLCLDLHHSWWHVFDPPGDPDYDFPAASADECMINQLKCFALLNEDWDHPFVGTIIRIPLRTPSR